MSKRDKWNRALQVLVVFMVVTPMAACSTTLGIVDDMTRLFMPPGQ